MLVATNRRQGQQKKVNDRPDSNSSKMFYFLMRIKFLLLLKLFDMV